MTRTVVPPPPAPAVGGPAGGLRAGDGGDDLPTKLVKYIPGETLAFFVPTAAIIGSNRDPLLVLVTVVAAVGTVGYLWYQAQSQPADRRPMTHFYFLAILAFAAWALVTAPDLADLVGIDAVASGVILAIGVFLIPLLDGVLTRIRQRS